jgi:putative transposase
MPAGSRSTGLRWGVEPICAVLSEHGTPIAPSTYYDTRRRRATAAELPDEQLKVEIERVWKQNYRVYGARKVWLQLNREGIPVARCTVERLMRDLGLEGARRGRRHRTTIADPSAPRSPDLVQRRFTPDRPDRLWVADFTYVPTWLGWRAARSMKTALVLDALEMALWTRQRQGVADLAGLVHHSDAGSQYTSIAFTERLAQAGAAPSVGSVGDAFDNALAETQIGLFKTEVIHRGGPWKGMDDVELAVLEWVDWHNHRRLHSACHDLTPAEYEKIYYRQHPAQQAVGVSTT